MTDVLSKDNRGELRKKGAYALKNKPKQPKRLLVKTLGFLKPYILSAFMMMTPSSTWNAVARDSSTNNKSLTENKATVSDSSKRIRAVMIPSTTKNMAVVDNLEQCLQKYGAELKLDVSNIEFSTADLALAKGKESAVAKQIWREAVRYRCASGKCTHHAKTVLRNLGLVKELSPEDRKNFESIVPAWKLTEFMSAGKISSMVEIKLNEAEAQNETMPLKGMARGNEAGETIHSHFQFMGPTGAVFGRGVGGSPEYHKTKSGKIQWYGDAHFYVDKETLQTVIVEMAKQNVRPLVYLLDKEAKELKVLPADNVPSQYKEVVDRHENLKKIIDTRIEMKLDALKLKTIPPKIDVAALVPSTERELAQKSRKKNYGVQQAIRMKVMKQQQSSQR